MSLTLLRGNTVALMNTLSNNIPSTSTLSHSTRSLPDTLTIIRRSATWERRGKTFSSLMRPLVETSVGEWQLSFRSTCDAKCTRINSSASFSPCRGCHLVCLPRIFSRSISYGSEISRGAVSQLQWPTRYPSPSGLSHRQLLANRLRSRSGFLTTTWLSSLISILCWRSEGFL